MGMGNILGGGDSQATSSLTQNTSLTADQAGDLSAVLGATKLAGNRNAVSNTDQRKVIGGDEYQVKGSIHGITGKEANELLATALRAEGARASAASSDPTSSIVAALSAMSAAPSTTKKAMVSVPKWAWLAIAAAVAFGAILFFRRK